MLSYIKDESKKRKWNFRGWHIFKIEEPFPQCWPKPPGLGTMLNAILSVP